MEVAAKLKDTQVSPQKVRLVANQLRGLSINKALNILTFSPKKTAGLLRKLLNSAVANAENNEGADIDELYVSSIYVDEGRTMKRIRARAKGRSDRILKRSSHVTIVVSDGQESE